MGKLLPIPFSHVFALLIKEDVILALSLWRPGHIGVVEDFSSGFFDLTLTLELAHTVGL